MVVAVEVLQHRLTTLLVWLKLLDLERHPHDFWWSILQTLVIFLLLLLLRCQRTVFGMKHLSIVMEDEGVLISHHLINDVLIEALWPGWHLDPHLLCIELLLRQTFLKNVVHLSKCHR